MAQAVPTPVSVSSGGGGSPDSDDDSDEGDSNGGVEDLTADERVEYLKTMGCKSVGDWCLPNETSMFCLWVMEFESNAAEIAVSDGREAVNGALEK